MENCIKIKRIGYLEVNGLVHKYQVYKNDFNTREGVYIYGEFETENDAKEFINNNQLI